MSINTELVERICNALASDAATSLRTQRMSGRLARLAEPEVLSAEQAELYDLNQVVSSVVDEALPLCQALGVEVDLQQDPRVPAVQMLVRPVEDALAAAMDLYLDEDLAMLRVRTYAHRNRAVATIECLRGPATRSDRPTAGRDWEQDLSWSMSGMGRAEIVIGDRATRAVGGRLMLQHRAGEMRLLLELPTMERPHLGWHERPSRPLDPPPPRERYDFPSTPAQPIIGAEGQTHAAN